MKNTIKLLAMACAATVVLTACSNENATPIVDDSGSTPASSVAASSTASKPQIDATSGMQQIDEENGAPYTVGYDVRTIDDFENIVVAIGYSDDEYNEGVNDLFATHIVVADTYEGKPVEGVSKEAFAHKRLKSIVLPDSVKVIGAFAFRYCDSLESVTMPTNLIKIDANAFQYCKALKEITFPDTLKIIEGAAFDYCESLENVVLPDTMESIGTATFDGCKKIQVTYKGQTYDYAHIDDLYKAVNGE